jgi:hypothetical protein
MDLRLPAQRTPKAELVTISKRKEGEFVMMVTAGGKVHEFEIPPRLVAYLIKEGLALIVE